MSLIRTGLLGSAGQDDCFDEHFVRRGKVASRGRDDRLRANEDFFLARDRHSYVVFADERGNIYLRRGRSEKRNR